MPWQLCTAAWRPPAHTLLLVSVLHFTGTEENLRVWKRGGGRSSVRRSKKGGVGNCLVRGGHREAGSLWGKGWKRQSSWKGSHRLILCFSFIAGEGASPQMFHTVSPGPPSARPPCRVPPTTPLNGGPGSLPPEPPSVPQAFPPLAGPGGLFPQPRLPDPVSSGGSSSPCFLPRGNAPSPAAPPPPAISLNAPSYSWGAALRSSLVPPDLGSPPAPHASSSPPSDPPLFHCSDALTPDRKSVV